MLGRTAPRGALPCLLSEDELLDEPSEPSRVSTESLPPRLDLDLRPDPRASRGRLAAPAQELAPACVAPGTRVRQE